MIKKIKRLTLAILLVMTTMSNAQDNNPEQIGRSKQFCLGLGAGALVGTVPPLIHNSGRSLQNLCTNHGAMSVGINAGIGLALLNWYNVGKLASKKLFNSSKGRYIAAVPALWLLSTTWKSNTKDESF